MRSPIVHELSERSEPRQALPSLPMLTIPRIRAHSSDEYGQDAPRSVGVSVDNSSPASYRPGSYHGYHHPSRVQSLSLGSAHVDRIPFAPANHVGHYPEYVRVGEFGGMAMSGDNKQRKRRGNLPKETTDKLRSWFMAHLSHPYPTEDEKQELMRQTGLQMNQISNWFINARRRQLPAMINNARVESDATSSGRTPDGKVPPSTEIGDHERREEEGASLSERGGSPSDDDFDGSKRRDTERGSI